MKTIGILGGLGPESTMAAYASITRAYYKLKGDYNYPEILIHSFSFDPFIKAGYALPGTVRAAIVNLHGAGCDFVIAACNSVHLVYEEVSRDIPIPWVSIMDATGEAIARRGLSTVVLLGTVFTMREGFYQRGLERHGIKTVTPDEADQRRVNDIIFGELITDSPTEASRQWVLGLFERLRERTGAQGLVLGCTELPFLIKPEHTTLPVFDTSILLSQKALELALEPESAPEDAAALRPPRERERTSS